MNPRRCGFTLLELMVAMALTAMVLLALSGIVYQSMRLGETVTRRSRGPWQADRVLHDCIRRVACACAPPGLPRETLPFALATGDGGATPLLRLDFHAPRPIAADGAWPVVERVAYELWPAPGHSGDGHRELRQLTLSPVPQTPPAWSTNILYSGPFAMDILVRAAPSEEGRPWGEWRADWPPADLPDTRRAGDPAADSAGAPVLPPLPGAVRLTFRQRGESPVLLETLVHAAQPPLRPVAPPPPP